MIFRTFTLAAVAITGLIAPASAGDAEKLKLAQELIELSQAKQMVEQMNAQMAPMQMQIVKSIIPEGSLSDAQLEIIVNETSTILIEEMTPAVSDLIDQMAPAYAEVYSEEVLRGVVEFYKSPIGVALLEKQPLVVERSMEVSMQWAQETMPAVMARAMPRIEERIKEFKPAE